MNGHRFNVVLAWLTLLVTATIVLGARLLGPGDLYTKDQPKTLAYTADMVLNGRWLLPRDVLFQPATKPPLYNWLAAVGVAVTGRLDEATLKWPSVAGALATATLVFVAMRRLWPDDAIGNGDQQVACRDASSREGPVASSAPRAGSVGPSERAAWPEGSIDGRPRPARPMREVAAPLAAAAWLASGIDAEHGSVTRLLYLCRPDMLQAAFLTGAWWAATRVLRDAPSRVAGELARREKVDAAFALEERSEHPHDRTPVHPSCDGRLPGRPPEYRERGPEATPSDPERCASVMVVAVVAFWLCAIGAALTKGPAALLALAYVPLAAWLIYGDVRRAGRLWFSFGLPALLVCVGAWLGLAYRIDPQHVTGVVLGQEVVDRVLEKSPEAVARPWHMMVVWFGSKFMPWSPLCIVAVMLAARRPRWFRHPLGPAFLWLAVNLVGFSLPAGKRIDYLLPATVPAALLATWAMLEIGRRVAGDRRVARAVATVVPMGLTIVVAAYAAHGRLVRSSEARLRWSDRVVDFCARVRPVIGDGSCVVLVRGKHPIPTLLHRHAGSALSPDDLATADWFVVPAVEGIEAALRSAPVPTAFIVSDDVRTGPIALVRGDALRARPDVLEALRVDATDWTLRDNPYRQPGTVWRDR